ncbi:cellulose-binding protein [Streptomyces sp. NPDC088387]|uniref:cellulose-binding protein n=1 Tax=Streptomyces sp. NPDC088387 TaxID=3365859 RepID=UPI003822C84A
MSGASVSPQGFVTVRGRGYRPDHVDRFTETLSRDRDAAWERAARLTVLARDMEEEADRLRDTVEGLTPQTYESLGEPAQHLFQLALQEATAVREGARREGQDWVAQAEEYARGVVRKAQEEADALCAEVEERARRLLLAADTEADEIRIGARREVKASRGEALTALREVRQRTTGVLTEHEKEYSERWAVVEREVAEWSEAVDAHHAERVARAEAALSAAKQEFAAAEESARLLQEEADARAAELLADARLREERIAHDTERMLCEHGERWDDVCAHMDHVRSSLAALTGGRAPAE